MQIGAANLIALQQQQQPKQAAAHDAGFAQALAETAGPQAEGFEPLFAKPAAPAQPDASAQAEAAPASTRMMAPGSRLDIKI